MSDDVKKTGDLVRRLNAAFREPEARAALKRLMGPTFLRDQGDVAIEDGEDLDVVTKAFAAATTPVFNPTSEPRPESDDE